MLKFVGKTVVYTYATIGIIVTAVIGAGVLMKSNELNSGVDCVCDVTGKVSSVAQSVIPVVKDGIPAIQDLITSIMK